MNSNPILAVDPGSTESAWLILKDGKPLAFDITNNDQLCCMLAQPEEGLPHWVSHLAIETLHVRGMPTAQEELDTQLWAGRFIEAFSWRRKSDKGCFTKIKRMDVKMHICGSSRANDSNIRQAIIDRFGGKDSAIGKKANPGPLKGIKDDLWSALAIAITHSETT